MDPLSGASVASKIVPLAVSEQRKLARRNEVQNLFKDLPKALKSDHRVPSQHKREVLKAVRGLRVNPKVGSCLKSLLEGDSSVLPALEHIASERLLFAAEVDDRAVVVAFMEAVRAHVIPSKRDVTGALGTIYRQQLGHGEKLGEISEQIKRSTQDSSAERQAGEHRLIEEIRAVRGHSAGAFDLITGGRAFSPQTPRVLKELGRVDRTIAQQVGQVLAEGAGPGLAGWASEQLASLRARGVVVTAHVGRLLMAEDQFAAAESVFCAAAEDDKEDATRQWVRAANAAFLRGDGERGEELLDHARGGGDPSHPALVLAEIQRGDFSPAEALERLEGVESVTDADALGIAAAVAQERLIDGELDEADRALADAEKIDRGEPRLRELRGIWRLHRANAAIVSDRDVDHDDLVIAEQDFLDLREDMRRRARPGDSAAMLSRAIDAAILSRRPDRAGELLDMASEQERRSPSGVGLARQAVLCGREQMALELLGGRTDSELARVVAASIEIDSPSEQTRERAVEALDRLLFSEDDDIRAEAALARAVACMLAGHPASWSQRAQEILAERDSAAAEIMRARAHLARGEFEEAERLLRRHSDKLEALSALVDAAGMRGDYERALQRSETLVRTNHSPAVRFQHAQLLKATKRFDLALRELSELARTSDDQLPDQREAAFRLAVEVAQTLGRYPEMEELCSDALAAGGQDEAFHWARASARFMLSRHAEALADLDAAGVEASTLLHAELLGRILYQAASLQEALRRNVELSARFGRPERLEALLIFFSARAKELDEETAAAISETIETFPDRFPDSVMVISREIPQSEEGIREFLAELAPPADDDREVVDQIRRGELVSAALAAVHGRSVSELWAGMRMLPVSYGDQVLSELERDEAREALGGPAVLDPTSLSVLALFGNEMQDAVLKALPGSLIAQSTLADADRGAHPINDPLAATGTVIRDPGSGEARFVARDERGAKAAAARQADHLKLARGLAVEPDALPDSEDQMERALADDEQKINPALRTWAATLTVAARRQLPVLSDDRRVRLSVRSMGIPSFGTLALLRALVDAGDLEEGVLAVAREKLLRSGAVGLHPSGGELSTLARELDFEPAVHLYQLLADPSFWTPDPVGGWGAANTLLHAVWEAAPEKLAPWVARIIDAAKQATPQMQIDLLCFGLLASAWGWTTASPHINRAFLQALIEAIRMIPVHLGQRLDDDPVEFALVRYGIISAAAPRAERAMFALRAIAQLKPADQIRALSRLWD
jgi:tetratricopeptide (TPR) repeat protein